jgi:hypothetical protein
VGPEDHYSEVSSSIKGEEFHNPLSDHQILKKEFTAWSWLNVYSNTRQFIAIKFENIKLVALYCQSFLSKVRTELHQRMAC